MLTSWEQVRAWIDDNNFKRWILYKDNTKIDKILDSSCFAVSDREDKIAMTEKYLRMAGGRAYACGYANAGKEDATIAEIRLDEQPAAGVGGSMYPSIGELRDSLTREIRAQIKAEEYERERKEFENAKKQFEEEKQSALVAIIHYFAPIGQLLMQKHLGGGALRNVAGLDANEEVHAKPIVVDREPETQEPETQEPQNEPSVWDVFTDEEGDKIGELMAKWKKADPDYLSLLESVVTMAANGDSKYTMAKSFL